jgi:hypothetical protein
MYTIIQKEHMKLLYKKEYLRFVILKSLHIFAPAFRAKRLVEGLEKR